jgi:hypothetical protein
MRQAQYQRRRGWEVGYLHDCVCTHDATLQRSLTHGCHPILTGWNDQNVIQPIGQ